MGVVQYLKSLLSGKAATAPGVTETEPHCKALEIKPTQGAFDCYPV